ncbi:protein of unknown function [Taphrina deformans PYCC 5710]|uniref:Rhodopsin domain-containing protein n=1 Tax=Taphrina deformans (strain PYCC 5710 / ATCC 11124 / CBS 356.35 / IMI 108563 / JCM 9778 / NBRC 8474) TaxID=1097556 RepID=R4XDK2_TAPDE|nr:protein of unknown function [Taphrina deformans PYCC 5710]|eukprot:CCG81424.1 protein of unknown function [Taphrina deformans PYCC 5710]
MGPPPSGMNISAITNSATGTNTTVTFPGPTMAPTAPGAVSTAVIVGVSTAFFFAATTAYLLRILQPSNRKLSFVIGQAVITVAFVLLCAIYALTIRLSEVSGGLMATEELDRLPYLLDAITNAQIVTTKFSFALSLQSFSGLSKSLRYRRIIKYVVIFQGVYALTILPHDLLCLPISAIWKEVLDGTHAHCQNFRVSYYTFGTFELVDDLVLLLLPIPVILTLPGKHHRYGAVSLFFLGACVLFADILKLIYIPRYGHQSNSDATPLNSKTLVWSFVASHLKSYLSLIVACLPSVRVTLDHLFRRQKPAIGDQNVPGSSRTDVPRPPESSKTDDILYETSVIELHVTRDLPQKQTASFQQLGAPWDSEKDDVVPRQGSLPNSSSLSLSKSESDPNRDNSTVNLPEDAMAGIMADMNHQFSRKSASQANWEELYPPTEVEIKPFLEQFDGRHGRPLEHNAARQSSLLSPTFSRASSHEVVGRSTLQKDYYDSVCEQRRQSEHDLEPKHTQTTGQPRTEDASPILGTLDSPTI